MSDNPQFVRTDRAIVHAFIALLQRKPFEKITVQDILDEAPVTRATFYAHFRDKYEIAEKMQEHFIETRKKFRQGLTSAPSMESLRDTVRFDKMYTDALLKIHTEKVDIRKVLASELINEYMDHSDSPTKEIEARIYAQATVELYLALMENANRDFTVEQWRQLLLPVAINLLHLAADEETVQFLSEKTANLSPRKLI